MQPTPEIEAFIARVDALPSGPGVSLDAALQPSVEDEAELRKLFATDKKNPRLGNPHVGLVDVFDAPSTIRTTRARIVQGKEDLSANYVMPLSEDTRRKEGAPSIVADLEEFKKNWSIFTEGSLSQLVDWNNVVAAGGSVLACLTPLDEADKVSKRAIRKFYHSNAYPTSDVDLFLWGLTPEQAEVKIKAIYEAVRDSVPWDVTCIRTKHTVSIHSQYPYRSVQIVLRLYQSPAEILAGFDIDAPCCAYDGNRIWANPRAVVAMMRQCNTVDMTRRSPSYEVRLAKYSRRAFEVYVPTLQRTEVDPTIYERSIARMEGLARLLVLEKLTDDNLRNAFLEGRRQLRGRPNALNRYNKRSGKNYKGDLKAETGMGVEMNDYDVASLHIPYGPGWDARRIDKLVYQTDLGMNSTFNPKNKGRRLHRHPAFFGTIEECLEDCCENCPKPIDDDEKALQKEEDENYIRDRIQFIEENPGRQSMTGSFNPIDVGEWSEQVYMKPTQQLFAAIAAHDRAAVQKLLGEGIDVNQRDHVGRTSLHVAIFSKAGDIACDLIDGGARISARLVDGRSPLHLAAQFDLVAVVGKLFEKNAKNVAEAEKGGEKGEEDKMDSQGANVERPSSEDDWSSHDDEDVEMSDADDEDEDADGEDDEDDDKPKTKKDEAAAAKDDTEPGDIPEEEDDQPDIIEIDALDWDFGFSALSYAVLFASMPTLEALLRAKPDITLVTKPAQPQVSRLHPLTLTILREDQDEACKIAERLIQAGASSSTADEYMRTILHAAVFNGRTKLVETLLRCDPNAKTVLDFPAIQGQNVVFPIVTAINKKHYGLVALLLANEAKLTFDEKDITRAQEASSPNIRRGLTMYGEVRDYLHLAYQPLEVAIRNHDDISKLLVALGAPADIGLMHCLTRYAQPRSRRTVREWVDYALLSISSQIAKKDAEELVVVDTPMADVEVEQKKGWKEFHQTYYDGITNRDNLSLKLEEERKADDAKRAKEARERLEDIKEFLVELQNILKTQDGKTWKDLYPSLETHASLSLDSSLETLIARLAQSTAKEARDYSYAFIVSSGYNRQNVPEHTVSAYDELYEACYSGDNDKVQRLCLPVEGQGATATPGLSGPLNISVKMIDKSISTYDVTGYTPLFAALAGRRWSTAKLVLAIATAQYHPDNEEDNIKFDTDVDMDDDSDNESCDSDNSDITVERKEIKFVDIATRPSAVQTDVHPKKMLDHRISWRKPRDAPPGGINMMQVNPLTKAVAERDLEAFVHIANLYDSLPQAVELGTDVLSSIMQQDQPDILDEYIRRTGAGIDVAGARKDSGLKDGEAELQVASNDANRMYLGLNVHGKKRMDLASKNDPNAVHNDEKAQVPLVWQAARGAAKGILSYLASDRPLVAYKFFAASHSDAKAIWFRRMLGGKDASKASGELETRLPAWLGWTISPLGESPLIAAIIAKDLEIVKLLAKLEPSLIAQALQTKIKFINVNVLLFAVRNQCDVKLIDYLLSRNVSPADRDSNKGWNIYHHICELNNAKLLEHFLNKLPKDVNEALLAQQSTKRLNTPFHIAVKKGHKEIIKTLIAYSKSTLLTRDIDGQTALHCSVKNFHADITQQLLLAAPAALVMENSVGNTPAELVALLELTERMQGYSQRDYIYGFAPGTIQPDSYVDVQPDRLSEVDRVEEELKAVRGVVGRLEGTGLKVGVVGEWVEEMEGKLRVFKERREKEKREEEEKKKRKEEEEKKAGTFITPLPAVDASNVKETVRHIRDALKTLSLSGSSGHTPRHLIHLLDVQKSVSATLAKVGGGQEDAEDENSYGRHRMTGYRRKKNRVLGGEGELDAEEDEDRKARRMSMVFQFIPVGPDAY
ncbi:hypothetical protein GALMADRAFT_123653 [Galerina marginata CBS 339.88]|uniref:Ankyrin repeat protein n=1 Tax=Galerina marginata (strain CBS 339.88) TaxID=685588 RepID=A0A067STD9_GALM3|nr:hypothetical protein GALMADRAFT_123653 [Galerina marginata CBS 339.88]